MINEQIYPGTGLAIVPDMKSENPSLAIYRDREISGLTPTSARSDLWQPLSKEDDRAERFEVVLRLLLVICVGAAMLFCGAPHESARLVNSAREDAPAVNLACVAVQTAAVPAPQKL